MMQILNTGACTLVNGGVLSVAALECTYGVGVMITSAFFLCTSPMAFTPSYVRYITLAITSSIIFMDGLSRSFEESTDANA